MSEPVRCERCLADSERSTVEVGGGIETAMFSHSYYDEDGVYHRHDPNNAARSFRCSRGHAWYSWTPRRCPADGCDFGTGPATIRYDDEIEPAAISHPPEGAE